MFGTDVTGIFQGDIIIKTAVELGLEDIRKSPWIIEDIFGSLLENPLLKDKYGLKEISRAKEFILNNEIPIYIHHRLDKAEFPCITISIGESREDKDLATLGDTTPFGEIYDPSEVGRPIAFLVPPFEPESYDEDTGIVEVPEDIREFRYISEGMIVINPEDGVGHTVLEKLGDNKFKITPGSELTGSQLAVIPRYAIYKARRESARSQEVYNIGCHVEGDPSKLIFLYSIVKYSLFRYREALLEHENFQLSRLTSTDMIKNPAFDVENVYSRFITLQGQVEESWVKTPMRFIEAVDLAERNTEGGITTLDPGIKIIVKDIGKGDQSPLTGGTPTEDDLVVTTEE